MKKSSGVRCSSGRANSSSFPVRYIPKATLKNKKLRTSPTMKGPEDKVIINKGSDKNELRFEGSNGGQSLRRSIVMDNKLQNQNEGPIHYVGYDDNQGKVLINLPKL